MSENPCAECAMKNALIEELRKQMNDLERDIREEARDAYAEGQWNERERHEQGGLR